MSHLRPSINGKQKATLTHVALCKSYNYNSDNNLHDRDAECLAEAIEVMTLGYSNLVFVEVTVYISQKNETITHLNLSHNNFSNNGATSFCYAFG